MFAFRDFVSRFEILYPYPRIFPSFSTQSSYRIKLIFQLSRSFVTKIENGKANNESLTQRNNPYPAGGYQLVP